MKQRKASDKDGTGCVKNGLLLHTEPQHGAALASRRIPDEPDCTRARRYETVRMIRELKTPRAGRLPLRKVTHKAYVTVCH